MENDRQDVVYRYLPWRTASIPVPASKGTVLTYSRAPEAHPPGVRRHSSFAPVAPEGEAMSETIRVIETASRRMDFLSVTDVSR
jgi:hypothetical protein